MDGLTAKMKIFVFFTTKLDKFALFTDNFPSNYLLQDVQWQVF